MSLQPDERSSYSNGQPSEIYRGHAIGKYNTIKLRVSQFIFKKFIDAKLDSGLSAREVLEYSGTPCDCCRNRPVVCFNKQDEAVQIKRGILNKNKSRL